MTVPNPVASHIKTYLLKKGYYLHCPNARQEEADKLEVYQHTDIPNRSIMVRLIPRFEATPIFSIYGNWGTQALCSGHTFAELVVALENLKESQDEP
jgi:hypothetical protein